VRRLGDATSSLRQGGGSGCAGGAPPGAPAAIASAAIAIAARCSASSLEAEETAGIWPDAAQPSSRRAVSQRRAAISPAARPSWRWAAGCHGGAGPPAPPHAVRSCCEGAAGRPAARSRAGRKLFGPRAQRAQAAHSRGGPVSGRAAVPPPCGSAAAKLKLGIHCIGGRRRRRSGGGSAGDAPAGRGRGRGREGPPLLRGRKGPWASGRHSLRRALRRARRDRIRRDAARCSARRPRSRRIAAACDERLEPRSGLDAKIGRPAPDNVGAPEAAPSVSRWHDPDV
jgi:hypothetical protein